MTPIIGERKAFIYRLIKTASRLYLFPFFRIQMNGLENLPQRDAFILLPKHQRWQDIPLLGLTISRPLYYIAKYELFLNPVSAWFISSMGGIPLNRSRPLESRRSLKMMIELLRKGEGVVVFPEGAYYRDSMGSVHAGLLRMVLSRLTIPLIPVGIRYSAGRGRTLVRINIGSPVYKDSSIPVDKLINNIEKELARLSGF